MQRQTVFLTGATGLVGSYLLKILLKNGHKVYVLARSKNDIRAKNRVIEVLNFWDKKVYRRYGKNLIVVGGDITLKNLGMKKSKLRQMTREVNEIFHCAASIAFNWPLNDIRKVNVDGTREVLEFAMKCRNLEKINHLSTAYVCGDYRGVFTEKDLDKGQRFNTTYEQSKFEAEKLIHKYRKRRLWIDIYRPALVIGESTSGKIFTKNQGFYQTLRLWQRGIFDKFPAQGLKINVISVDLLSQAVYDNSVATSTQNSTYHVFTNDQINLATLLRQASVIGNFKIKVASFKDFEVSSLSPVKRLILQDYFLRYNPNVHLKNNLINFHKTKRISIKKMLAYAYG